MKRSNRLFAVFLIFLIFFCAQKKLLARDFPVSIIETGKTPGFDPPTLRLNMFSVLFHFLPLLNNNRSLQEPFLVNGDENLGETGTSVDFNFMKEIITREVTSFNQLIDPYDDPENPSPGYTWDMKIFHPGSVPGQLSPDEKPYPVIIFCVGAQGSHPSHSDALDWMGTYYARRGYLFVIPVFIENYSEIIDGESRPNEAFESISEISTDIYALQVSHTIDYLKQRFSLFNRQPGVLDSDHVTLIGHSLGGYVAQKAAAQDSRISRLCLLSSVFIYYGDSWAGYLLDTKDTCDLLNRLPKQRGMALHVQRFTKPPYSLPCPDWDPECDWIPPVDGFITQVDLSLDPWKPYLCEGVSCGIRDGTYYNYLLYEGPKQNEIKNNILVNHSGITKDDPENDKGKQLTVQLIDEFFARFP